MAAAFSDVDQLAQRSSFYDPVCGSGTICIEAALIGHNIAPGFNRSFTCETWDWVDPAILKKYVTKPRQRQTTMLN